MRKPMAPVFSFLMALLLSLPAMAACVTVESGHVVRRNAGTFEFMRSGSPYRGWLRGEPEFPGPVVLRFKDRSEKVRLQRTRTTCCCTRRFSELPRKFRPAPPPTRWQEGF
ncbi:MAG: hypothetical protein AAF430_18310 [Myxococcota bacterium]